METHNFNRVQRVSKNYIGSLLVLSILSWVENPSIAEVVQIQHYSAMLPAFGSLCNGGPVPCNSIDSLLSANIRLDVLPFFNTLEKSPGTFLPLSVSVPLFRHAEVGVGFVYSKWNDSQHQNYDSIGPLTLSAKVIAWPLFSDPSSRSSIAVHFQHEQLVGPFSGINSLGVQGSLGAVRVSYSYPWSFIELGLSLGTLFDWNKQYGEGEAGARIAVRVPPKAKDAFSIFAEGLARSPAWGNIARPLGSLTLGISTRAEEGFDNALLLQVTKTPESTQFMAGIRVVSMHIGPQYRSLDVFRNIFAELKNAIARYQKRKEFSNTNNSVVVSKSPSAESAPVSGPSLNTNGAGPPFQQKSGTVCSLSPSLEKAASATSNTYLGSKRLLTNNSSDNFLKKWSQILPTHTTRKSNNSNSIASNKMHHGIIKGKQPKKEDTRTIPVVAAVPSSSSQTAVHLETRSSQGDSRQLRQNVEKTADARTASSQAAAPGSRSPALVGLGSVAGSLGNIAPVARAKDENDKEKEEDEKLSHESFGNGDFWKNKKEFCDSPPPNPPFDPDAPSAGSVFRASWILNKKLYGCRWKPSDIAEMASAAAGVGLHALSMRSNSHAESEDHNSTTKPSSGESNPETSTSVEVKEVPPAQVNVSTKPSEQQLGNQEPITPRSASHLPETPQQKALPPVNQPKGLLTSTDNPETATPSTARTPIVTPEPNQVIVSTKPSEQQLGNQDPTTPRSAFHLPETSQQKALPPANQPKGLLTSTDKPETATPSAARTPVVTPEPSNAAQNTTRFVGPVQIKNHGQPVGNEGLVDLQPTIQRIEAGQKLPYPNDGIVFQNRESLLPAKPSNYYREYVHPTPSITSPGPQRIVRGQNGEYYYTPDHYKTFIPLNKTTVSK